MGVASVWAWPVCGCGWHGVINHAHEEASRPHARDFRSKWEIMRDIHACSVLLAACWGGGGLGRGEDLVGRRRWGREAMRVVDCGGGVGRKG